MRLSQAVSGSVKLRLRKLLLSSGCINVAYKFGAVAYLIGLFSAIYFGVNFKCHFLHSSVLNLLGEQEHLLGSTFVSSSARAKMKFNGWEFSAHQKRT